MTTKTKKKSTAVTKPSDPERGKNLARIALTPTHNAAAIIMEFANPFGEQDVLLLAESLREFNEKVADGDMKRIEAMLLDQAHALQSMFMNYARRAQSQEYMKNLESFFRMALKAQNQCRMTLETLATIKNPPIVYARQANVTTGPQQVNNGISTASGATIAHAEKNQNQSNELLEVRDGERLDTGTAGTTSGTDKELATVGKIDGAKDNRGESAIGG